MELTPEKLAALDKLLDKLTEAIVHIEKELYILKKRIEKFEGR